MADYRYDVAISFAGEQRAVAEQLARCLQSNQVSVFYDEFEIPELWGKDLFEHLSDVYSKQARYCIIFASRHYADKAWTTHERKSAQERALAEKGNEYILPVRFDDTAIPHCAITGPLFLIGGVMFLLSGMRMIPRLDTLWVWPVLVIGIGIAFLLEWLYGKRPAS